MVLHLLLSLSMIVLYTWTHGNFKELISSRLFLFVNDLLLICTSFSNVCFNSLLVFQIGHHRSERCRKHCHCRRRVVDRTRTSGVTPKNLLNSHFWKNYWTRMRWLKRPAWCFWISFVVILILYKSPMKNELHSVKYIEMLKLYAMLKVQSCLWLAEFCWMHLIL